MMPCFKKAIQRSLFWLCLLLFSLLEGSRAHHSGVASSYVPSSPFLLSGPLSLSSSSPTISKKEGSVDDIRDKISKLYEEGEPQRKEIGFQVLSIGAIILAIDECFKQRMPYRAGQIVSQALF